MQRKWFHSFISKQSGNKFFMLYLESQGKGLLLFFLKMLGKHEVYCVTTNNSFSL